MQDMGRELILTGDLNFREFERVLSMETIMSSESFTYKGISAGKYVEGDIEAFKSRRSFFKLKEQKIIITSLVRTKKKKAEKQRKKKEVDFLLGKRKLNQTSRCNAFFKTICNNG